MDNHLRALLRRLGLFLDLWPWLDEAWRERLREEMTTIARLLLRR